MVNLIKASFEEPVGMPIVPVPVASLAGDSYLCGRQLDDGACMIQRESMDSWIYHRNAARLLQAIFRGPDPGSLIIRSGPQFCGSCRRSCTKWSNERSHDTGVYISEFYILMILYIVLV